MQRILLLITFLICFSQTFSQSLVGQWEGWYSSDLNNKDTTILKLQFQLKKDSTYDVYSFSRFKNFKGVCKMSYKMLSSRSIYLEETEVVKSTADYKQEIVLQRMTLDITNGFMTMKGKWLPTDAKFKTSGNVYLMRK